MAKSKWRCAFGHEGEIVAVGKIIVTEKRNKPDQVIPGMWNIRKCHRCRELYSTPQDQLKETTYALQRKEETRKEVSV